MERKPKILGICGSTKKNSTNHILLRYFQKHYANKLDITLFKGVETLPYFNIDLDKGNTPKEVLEFRKMIEDSDGLLICTPEYIFSLPGSLKNAIEWCVSITITDGKPILSIVAAASGDRAYESLSLILETLGAVNPKELRLLIKGAKSKINEQLELTDEELKTQLDEAVHTLVQKVIYK